MFLNCSTCFGRHTAHHQELKNCNCSLWFYIRLWLPAAAMAQRCDRVVEFIIPMFLNCSTCFGRNTAHHQELKNCNCSLWFYIRLWLPAAAMAQRCDRVVEFIIPMFLNCSTCFGWHTAHHQEFKKCNCSLWFYIRLWLPVAAMAQRCDRVVEFIIPTFLNCSTCFGRHTAHHQELKNCNCSLWFYIRLWVPAAAMVQPSQRPETGVNLRLLNRLLPVSSAVLYDLSF